MSNTKYYYIRTKPAVSKKADIFYLDNGQKAEVREIHPRGAPTACVAYQRRRDEDMSPPVEEGETLEQTRAKGWDLVTYAVSACNSKHDEFLKAEGRVLAHKRLTGSKMEETPMDKAYCFNIESTASANEVIEMILDEVANNTNVPSHVRWDVKNWVNS